MIAVVFVTVIAVSSEEDRAMDTGNVYKKFSEIWTCGFGGIWAEQTGKQRQTGMQISVFCPHTGCKVMTRVRWN